MSGHHISRTASMRRLSKLLFSKDERPDSEGESDVSTACEEDVTICLPNSSKDGFMRCTSEESTLPGSLPFSRCPSGSELPDEEDELTWDPPQIPSAFHFPACCCVEPPVIAVARDGTCSFLPPTIPGAKPAYEEDSPVLAVARDGTCLFVAPDSDADDEEDETTEGDEDTDHPGYPIDSAQHASYFNHLSYAPWESQEEAQPVVMVSPAGTAWYFEDQRTVDWSAIAESERH